MAQLADILQQERDRDTEDKWGLIHLYKTGSFYSAYEWSAWLIAVITFNDEVRMQTKDRKPIAVTRIPMANCHIVGDLHDWDDIDHAKCMRFAEPGVALPIGNLTSQLFSNVYLNVFDQFIKRDILCRHYGRYVDDSVQIDPDRDWLIRQVPREREFLADELGLQLHMGKLHIREIRQGVEFLGAFVKPYRDYVSNKTLDRMTKKIQEIDLRNEDKAVRTIDSYLGILSHTASRCITQDLLSKPLAA